MLSGAGRRPPPTARQVLQYSPLVPRKKAKRHPRVRAIDIDKDVEESGPASVPAQRARRRLHLGYVVLSGLAGGLIVIPALLERFGTMRSGAWVPAMFVGLAVAFGFPLLSRGFRPERHGSKRLLLTARTVTGTRTVDMANLTQIRRARYLGGARSQELFWIKDPQGVSLRVERDVLMGSNWRRGVVSSENSNFLRAVKISRYTAVGLGLVEPSIAYRTGRACVDFILALWLIPMGCIALGLLISWLARTV